MRVPSVVFASLFLAGVAAAQAPSSKPAAARASSSRPDGTLAQVMRGILFPNSNLIFDVQTKDPAVAKPDVSPGGAFAGVYTGWQVVENAAVALEEAADLIMKPGRLCSNGKPVPVQRADFVKFAQGLREAGKAVLKAAQEKNQEKVSDLTTQLADACVNCHVVYRNSPPGGPRRCVP